MNMGNAMNLNRRIAQFIESIPIPKEFIEVVWNSVILASREAVSGLPIGARAPEFSLVNSAGQTVSSKAILQTSPLVVCFLRGDWCPICGMELAALREIHPELMELGAHLVVIHPQPAAEGRFGSEIPFDVCSDDTHEVMAAFDVRFPVPESVHVTYRDVFGLDLTKVNAGGLLNLPVPATFVIDRDGVIKGRQFDPDFRLRAEPSYIISAVERLPGISREFAMEAEAFS